MTTNPQYKLSVFIKTYNLDNGHNGNPNPSLEFVEAAYCLRLFEVTGFNKTQTALRLNISRTAFYRKLRWWLRLGYITEVGARQ